MAEEVKTMTVRELRHKLFEVVDQDAEVVLVAPPFPHTSVQYCAIKGIELPMDTSSSVVFLTLK
jgi:hypothetical protein